MTDEIVVVLEEGGKRPRFRLAEDGSPPRITSAAVVDVAADQPIWWLVPASFSVALPFTVEEPTAAEVDDLADDTSVDPIEDLPPSDPRHQDALAVRGRMNESSPQLASLTYGVVPEGFRQASPESGITALLPGRVYHLTVIGPGGHGSLAFEAK